MKPWHYLLDTSCLTKYSGQEIDLYSSFEKSPSILEDIVNTAVATVGFITTAGIGYVLWLSHAQKKAEQHSPKLQSESEVQGYFSHLLSHYELPKEKFELRITYHGRDYIKRHPDSLDSYLVFINLQKGTTKARVRHELLHYVHDNFRYDMEKAKTIGEKFVSVFHYAFVAEPKAIKESKTEV